MNIPSLRIGGSKALIIALFAAASLLRFADVFRPINHASWRECDLGSIARNFVEEGMNPFYPRIDWRGDGPGYAEMELPIYPWLIAVTYKIFGIHDFLGRVWAFLFSLGTLFFFFRLAREYLSLFTATVAFAFFALNPLMVELSTSIQPEGLMMFTYIAGVYYFLKWLKSDSGKHFWAATAFTALTMLSKAPSAHIGLFFGILLIEKFGWTVFGRAKVWVFGVLSVLPSLLWYFHAKNLWIAYGNSLGVSNEYHWIGWDFFTDPTFFEGILKSELITVWISFGLVAGLFAIWRGYGEETSKHSLLWLASIFAFYIVAARTTSETWAYYYHAFSIPPVALLFGFSVKKIWDYADEFAANYRGQNIPRKFGRVAVLAIVMFSISISFLAEARQLRWKLVENREVVPAYVFAQQIRAKMTNEGLLLASGGHCYDPKGYQLAYNASYMFYWLEKKGWNVCVEDQSIMKFRELAQKGAVYFVAEKKFLGQKPPVENELRQTFPITAESDEYLVFDLAATNQLITSR